MSYFPVKFEYERIGVPCKSINATNELRLSYSERWPHPIKKSSKGFDSFVQSALLNGAAYLCVDRDPVRRHPQTSHKSSGFLRSGLTRASVLLCGCAEEDVEAAKERRG